jgi:WD40 repeat protein/tRNA A-37 threonylcarbamoyl transferase component Bud32
VPGHELLSELGRGGMGVVYKARHRRLDRVVAVKMILAGAYAGNEQRRRFLIEATAVARLQHPNVVQIYETGEADGKPYFSLEFVDGGSLDLRLRGTPQPPRQAAALVQTLARAMEHAHQKGIVHRDLKPANVLLTADGTPKITDFGLAKNMEADGPSADGAVMGTPSYMAPEQAGGQARTAGPAADVYALGAILYEMLTGRPPFKGTTLLETLEQVRTREPVSPERLQAKAPRDLVTICLKCLRKEPHKRYPSAGELADDLHHFLAGEPILARPTPARERVVKWARRRPAVAALGAATLLSVVLGFSLVTWKWRQALAAEEKTSEALVAQREATARAEAAEQDARLAQAEESRQKNVAQEALREARTNLYLHNVALAEREWADGNAARVEELLSACPPDARRWEWYHLRRLSRTGRTSVVADPNHLGSLAFSPDGKLFATGGGAPLAKDGAATVNVWDTFTRQLRLAIPGRSRISPDGHAGVVTQVSFSPDGKTLASASTVVDVAGAFKTGTLPRDLVTGEVKVWDLSNGKLLFRVPGLASVAFSPDGRQLAFGAADHRVRFWDVATRSEVSEPLPERPGWAVQLAYAPDGNSLAARYSGFVPSGERIPVGFRALTVWDVRTRKPLLSREGSALLGTCPFSPDGARIAVSDPEGVKVVDVRVGKELLHLRDAGKEMSPVAFRPDGRLLVSADGQIVKVWDAASGTLERTLRGPTGNVESVAFAPPAAGLPGDVLVSAGDDGRFDVWDLPGDTGVRTLAGHGKVGFIMAAAFSPDGRLLAESNADGATVNVWEPGTGRLVRRLRGVPAMAVALSPDGRRLAAGTGDPVRMGRPGELRLYDLQDEQAPPRVFPGHSRFVTCLAYAPDGKSLVSASADERGRTAGEMICWSADTGTDRWRLPLSERVRSLAFGPDSRVVAVAAVGVPVRLYDAADGSELRAMENVEPAFNRLAFSPTGERLAGGTEDGVLHLWDAATGAESRRFRAHSGSITGLSFSADGERLASASYGFPSARGELKVWDARTGRQVLKLPGQLCVAFSPGGRFLAGAGSVEAGRPGVVTLWDAAPDPELFSVREGEGEAHGVAYTPDGRHLVTSHTSGMVVLRDAETGQELRAFKAPDTTVRVALSPDGRSLAASGAGGALRAWDSASRKDLWKIDAHSRLVYGLAYSPDGKQLASASQDKTVQLRDASDGRPLHTLEHADVVFECRYSPDGKLLATACRDRLIRFWDPVTGKLVRELAGHAGPVVTLAFGPGGRVLASSGSDRSIRLWDVAAGRELDLPGRPAGAAVAASTLGQLLSGGPVAPLRAACAFDAGRPPRHFGVVWRVAFSPDGRRLASAGADRAVKVWDLERGGEPVELGSHAHTVFDLAFAPDGRRLASAGYDGTVKVWRVPPPGQ